MDAAPFVPATKSLAKLAEAAGGCEGCELYANATQTVFGAGPRSARLLLVGEQPGDVEDRRGEPFVGPAGRILDQALDEAHITRSEVYVTNAVKHFHFVQRGKRRLHQTPRAGHVNACRPWLSAELAAVRPELVVALGATASQSLFGPSFRLTQHRGERLPWPPPTGPYAESTVPVAAAFATIHPSAVLRGENRAELLAGLVADLRVAAGA